MIGDDNMTDENTIPERCIKYDELLDQIAEIESEIESLREYVIIKTETVKEYLLILKDANAAGMSRETPMIKDPLKYYITKIEEINDELMVNDEIIKESEQSLKQCKQEWDDTQNEVLKSGWVKIKRGVFGGPIQWISPSEYEHIKGVEWFTRLS